MVPLDKSVNVPAQVLLLLVEQKHDLMEQLIVNILQLFSPPFPPSLPPSLPILPYPTLSYPILGHAHKAIVLGVQVSGREELHSK